jgi:hypothetical protein
VSSKEKFGDARDQLPPTCPECGARLVDAELDTSMVSAGTASGTYACGARLVAWEGPEGPVRVRRCGREDGEAKARRQPEADVEEEPTEEDREFVEFLRGLREGDELN